MIAPKGYTTASSPWSGSKLFARSSNGTPVSEMITGHYRQMLRIELDEDKLVAVIVFVASLPLNTIYLLRCRRYTGRRTLGQKSGNRSPSISSVHYSPTPKHQRYPRLYTYTGSPSLTPNHAICYNKDYTTPQRLDDKARTLTNIS